MFHEPVLVQELLQLLDPLPEGYFVDCTIGGGGHAKALLDKFGDKIRLLGFDLDPDSIEAAERTLMVYKDSVNIFRCSYSDIAQVLDRSGISSISGALADLGVSLHQLKSEHRGFSFKSDAPLDMRFDYKSGIPARTMLKQMSPSEIEKILRDYGELRRVRKLAKEIWLATKEQKLETTGQLAKLCKKHGFGHPKLLARVFQAVRIAVNRELENLERFLRDAPERLQVGGKIAVISYHSLEDRLVKHRFRELANSGRFEVLTKKPVVPTEQEVQRNPRARSAKLRVLKRVA